MTTPEDALSQLRQLIIQQKTAHLPELTPGTQLSELHDKLAAYEEATTFRVRAALQRQSTASQKELSSQIEAQLLRAEQEALPENDLRQRKRYQLFKDRLDQLNGLADEISRNSQAPEETP